MTKRRLCNPHLRHDGSDFYTCMVCNSGSMHRKNVSSHLNGYPHRQSLVRTEREKRMEDLNSKILFWWGVDELGLPRWSWHLKGMALDYIYQDKFEFSAIEWQLAKYENMERTSLLELALWKASCLDFDGSRNFHTMQDILDQWALDDTFDPTAYKAGRRFTSNVTVVMRRVVEFL